MRLDGGLKMRLIEALNKLNRYYPSVFQSVLDTVADVVETTMDTLFIYFVRDLLTRYKKLTDEEKLDRYNKKDFVLK